MTHTPALPDGVTWRGVGQTLGALALGAVVLAVVISSFPVLVGADGAYVVRSPSMSPAIGAGSVVFVEDVPSSAIAEGDVITFQTGATAESRVTHRVVEVREGDERRFRTKGDANPTPDSGSVGADQVVGRVSVSLPLVGYVISFAGSRLGLVALVVVPAIALFALELRDIIRDGDAGGDRE